MFKSKRMWKFGVLGLAISLSGVLSFASDGVHAQTYSCPIYYVIRSTENLDKILSKYMLSAERLKNLNPGWNGELNEGRKLKVGDLCHLDTDEGRADRYVVQRGDTLYSISRRFGLFVSDLMYANRMTDDLIAVGQSLIIPNVYTTLEEIRSNISYDERMLLAKLVFAEARGETFDGQVAVAAVVLNRVLSPGFPSTIGGVIFQEGQFSSVDDGKLNVDDVIAMSYLPAVDRALSGYDPTFGALFFANLSKAKPETREMFRERIEVTKVIGNHVFGKRREDDLQCC